MASEKYGSIFFPFRESEMENQTFLKRTRNIEDTIKSSIKAFFKTRSGQRRGNPIGSTIHEYKHQLIKPELMFGIEDEIKEELQVYFRGIQFPSIKITQELDEEDKTPSLIIKITFSVPGKNLQNLLVTI